MIHFVYFDVGGVVMQDFSGTDKWSELLHELGIKPDQNKEFNELWDKHKYDIYTGKNVDSLLPIIKQKFNPNISANYSLLLDGFVKRFKVNMSIWPVIDAIHKKCRIGLFTIQYTGMLVAIKAKGILPDIKWDVVIDSSIEGVSKSDNLMFELAERKAGFKGEQIFYIENTTEHIDKAEDHGWNTFLYDPTDLDKSNRELLHKFNMLVSQ